MHASAGHQGSEPVVNREESNGKLPHCVHCQESDNGSLSSSRVVLDLMVLSNLILKQFKFLGKLYYLKYTPIGKERFWNTNF